MSAFSTQPTFGVSSVTPSSSPYYLVNNGLASQVSNWQAALVTSTDNETPIEFQLTGTKNTSIGGGTAELTNPVINGLQIVPVLAFLQPAVNANNDPLEYGPLAAGTYMLMHVHGAVNVNGSQPSYAGGWYRLVYSTTNNPPTISRLNYPEINRYLTGQAAAQAYAGRSYTFTHAGGFIEFSFDDEIASQYPNITTCVGAVNTNATIEVGAAYPTGSEDLPVAPIFALISISDLSAQGPAANPVIFTPSYSRIPVGGIPVSMYSTTPNATIYYTISSSTTTAEPAEAPNPIINSNNTPGSNTFVYSSPGITNVPAQTGTPINIIWPTKIRAACRVTGLTDSAMSSIYYYDIYSGDI